MFTLSAKIREVQGRKVKTLRKKGILPAILYGHKIKNLNLELDLKDFEKAFKEAGESSLLQLKIDGQKEKGAQEVSVLIKDVKRDPLTEKFLHVDFYQPILEEEMEALVPLVFEGESKAVKDLGGTLFKEISEVKVKSLPQNLPREIKVDIGKLVAFEDRILIKDLPVPKGVKILRNPEEILALVSRPSKVEEELEKPIEEKVEEVEKIEKKKEEKAEEEKTEPKKEESKPQKQK